MFHHILVPLDGSLQAERALPIAARLARASNGMLILVRAIPAAPEAGTGSHLFRDTLQKEQEEARRYLVTVASSQHVAGLPVVVSLHQGSVVAGIQAAIVTYQADLIVGCDSEDSPGFSSFSTTLAGQLCQRFSVPLLLLPARGPSHYSLAESRHPVTVLVAFSGLQPEQFLIAPAAALLAALTAQVPGHLHFISHHLAPIRLVRTSVEQPVERLHREQRFASTRCSVLVKDGPSAEKRTGEDGDKATDVLALEMPLLREGEQLARLVRTYPCLLVPSRIRGDKENNAHV